MSRTRGPAPLLLSLAAMLSLAAACSGSVTRGEPASRGSFKVGVDLPESGNEASEGLPTLNGIRFAVDQANARGGVGGYRVELLNLDDSVNGTHDPAKGAENVQSMVADPKVLGMVGPFNSNVAQAEIPITNRASMAQISPSNTNECLTKDVPLCKGQAKTLRPTGVNNYFRLPATADVEGPALADYAYDVLKYSKLALGSDSETFGKGIADDVQREFEKKGGTIVDRQDFDVATTVDFRPWLTRAKHDGAQGVYYGGTDATKACVVRAQMRGIFDASVPEMGAGMVTAQCIHDAADNAVGTLGSVPSVDIAHVPGAQPTLDAFRREFTKPTDYGDYTMFAYIATDVLLKAIAEEIDAHAGRLPTRAQVRDRIAKTKDFSTPIGHIAFDANGDVSPQRVSLYVVKQATEDEAKAAPACAPDSPRLCYIFVTQLSQ
jgi:branched-chain amino acid transport system substrate-binding protein